jgi:hypothetical protein
MSFRNQAWLQPDSAPGRLDPNEQDKSVKADNLESPPLQHRYSYQLDQIQMLGMSVVIQAHVRSEPPGNWPACSK